MPKSDNWFLQFFDYDDDEEDDSKHDTHNCKETNCPRIFVTTVYLINNTNGTITDKQCNTMIEALNIQLQSFCDSWSLKSVVVVLSSSPPSGSYQIYLTTDTQYTIPGISSYRNNKMIDGTVKAYVCVNLILPTGTTNGILYPTTPTSYSVSQYVSYELLDMILNPTGAKYFLTSLTINNITMQAMIIAGVCDAVVPLSYTIVTSDSTNVNVSDYTLPSWYSSSGISPFNYKRTLTSPFQLSPRLSYTAINTASTQSSYYIKYT